MEVRVAFSSVCSSRCPGTTDGSSLLRVHCYPNDLTASFVSVGSQNPLPHSTNRLVSPSFLSGLASLRPYLESIALSDPYKVGNQKYIHTR